MVEVTFAATVPLHRVEAQLERRDPLGAIRAADCAVYRAFDGDGRRLDQLGPVVDLIELVEALDTVRVGDGDQCIELPVVLARERDALLVRDRPEDVRRDGASEVGVQLGEPFALENHRVTLRRRSPPRVVSTRAPSSARWGKGRQGVPPRRLFLVTAPWSGAGRDTRSRTQRTQPPVSGVSRSSPRGADRAAV